MFTVFRGGDGSVFHPDILKNETLHVFNKDACQSIPIVFEKEIDSNGIPGYRYVNLDPTVAIYFNAILHLSFMAIGFMSFNLSISLQIYSSK